LTAPETDNKNYPRFLSVLFKAAGELVGNPGSQPGLATSFQLVRLVGCGLYAVNIYLHFYCCTTTWIVYKSAASLSYKT